MTIPLGKAKPTKAPKEKKVPAAKRRKKLIRQLDEITSLYVRERDQRCITCGGVSNLQCGHLITRSHYAVRWDLMNCAAQCASCNLTHEFNPHIYVAAFIAKHGLDEYKALVARDTPRKWSEAELQAKLEEITVMYDALKFRGVYSEPATIYQSA